MTRYSPAKVWQIEDGEDIYGIVKCRDGDLHTFWKLTAELLQKVCADDDTLISEPVWAWWRWNPDWSRTYPKILAEANGPGCGNWRGALVRQKGQTP